MRGRAGVWIAALYLAVACNNKTSTQTTGSTPTPSPAITTSGSPSPGAPCQRATGGADSHVLLTAVRVETDKNADHMTFEFNPTSMGKVMPRYELDAATPPITEDGSGEQIQIQGKTFAQIVFHGASGVDTDQDPAVVTYKGPKEFKPGFEVLLEAERSGDFEATLSWAFGLSRQSCWKVSAFADPLRLTIDFPH